MPVAALGFAYTLEPLLRVLGQDDNAEGSHRDGTSRVMVMVEGEGSHHEALRVAQELRREGIPVEMEVCGRGLDESLSYAEANGISEVISVDGRGESTTHRVGAGAGLDRSKG